MRGIRYSYKILVRKSEWKRPLGIPRHRWEDNIKMELQEMKNQFHGLMNMVMNLWVP
jgi:hypothetical protein